MKALFKNIRFTTLFLMVAIAMVIGSAMLDKPVPGLVSDAIASTTNFPKSTPVYMTPIQITGTFTTTFTPVKFQIPFAARLVGFSAVGRTASGTITVDLQAGGVSLLSAPISLSTNVAEATISTAAVADEATITSVITFSGASNPTAVDITILPTFVR